MTRTTKVAKKKASSEIYGWTVISISLVPVAKECARVKNRPLNILATVLAQKYDIPVNYGERMLTMIIPPETPAGDAERFNKEILSYISLYDTYTPEEDRKCAVKILNLAEEKGLDDVIGYSIILDLLQKSYMEEYGYSVWTV